jgi:hypothetical protein
LSFVAANAAFAETVRDTKHNFHVDVPAGWKSQQNPTDDIRWIAISPRAETTGGLCNVITDAFPKSATRTQADIDRELEGDLTPETWKSIFESSIFIQDVKILASGSEKLHGRAAHYVVLTFNSITPGAPIIAVKVKQYLHAIPGEMFFVTCRALQSGYASEEKDFQTVFTTFEPINGKLVAAVAPTTQAASLTLYTGGNFGGVSRVVTRDTPDLADAGWRDRAGSISVSGGDRWQVCDRADYAGHCQVISSTLRQSFPAASVRRISGEQLTIPILLQAGGAQGAGVQALKY